MSINKYSSKSLQKNNMKCIYQSPSKNQYIFIFIKALTNTKLCNSKIVQKVQIVNIINQCNLALLIFQYKYINMVIKTSKINDTNKGHHM